MMDYCKQNGKESSERALDEFRQFKEFGWPSYDYRDYSSSQWALANQAKDTHTQIGGANIADKVLVQLAVLGNGAVNVNYQIALGVNVATNVVRAQISGLISKVEETLEKGAVQVAPFCYAKTCKGKQFGLITVRGDAEGGPGKIKWSPFFGYNKPASQAKK